MHPGQHDEKVAVLGSELANRVLTGPERGIERIGIRNRNAYRQDVTALEPDLDAGEIGVSHGSPAR